MKLAVRLPTGEVAATPTRTGSSHGSSPRLSLASSRGSIQRDRRRATKEVYHLDRGSLGPVAVDPGFEESVLELGGSVEQTDGGVGQFGRPAGSGTELFTATCPWWRPSDECMPRSCRPAVMTSLLPGGAGDSVLHGLQSSFHAGRGAARLRAGVEVDGRTVADIGPRAGGACRCRAR